MTKTGVLATPVRPTSPAGTPPAARPPRRHTAVGQWKRQLAWFASAMTALVVLVAGASATSMWQVISQVARAEQAKNERSEAAVDARLAVLEVDRLLSQTM